MYDTGKAFYRHYEYIQRENSLYSRWFQKRGLSYPQFRIMEEQARHEQDALASLSPDDMKMFNNVYAAIVDGLEKHLFSDPS